MEIVRISADGGEGTPMIEMTTTAENEESAHEGTEMIVMTTDNDRNRNKEHGDGKQGSDRRRNRLKACCCILMVLLIVAGSATIISYLVFEEGSDSPVNTTATTTPTLIQCSYSTWTIY